MKKRIYLDWNATAPTLPEVQDAMLEVLRTQWGNASSIHQEGQRARAIVERARRALANAINAPPQSVVFTGGATESNNQILRTLAKTIADPHFVCTVVEHPSVLEVMEDLEATGVKVTRIGVDELGRLKFAELRDALEDGAKLVSVMLANNELGTVYSIPKVVEMAKEYGALVHCDATQALGRILVNFGELGADYLSLSFHKMGGPKGIGAIVVREGLVVNALLSGGHQERGRRPGTENVPAAAGLDAACRALELNLSDWQASLIKKREWLTTRLQKIPGLQLRGDQESTLPNTVNIALDGVDGEDLLLALDLDGIALSSGSACTAGSLEPSHVVLALGLSESDARRSIRLSFGPSTTDAELEEATTRIHAAVDRLRRI